MRDPDAVRAFREAIDAIPGVHWEVDVHSHAKILAEGINAAAELAFPCGKQRPKPPMRAMSDLTWDIIRAKRSAQQTARHVGRVAGRLAWAGMCGGGGLPMGAPARAAVR
eukprot:8246103-Lingulodinium_polyedra.AAC.1